MVISNESGIAIEIFQRYSNFNIHELLHDCTVSDIESGRTDSGKTVAGVVQPASGSFGVGGKISDPGG